MQTLASRALSKKSAQRVMIVDGILSALKSDSIFRTLDFCRKSEDHLKTFMYHPLLAGLKEVHRALTPTVSEASLERKARASILWEADKTTTINHVRFLGTQHRPDFVVRLAGIRIAVEIKRGESGQTVREGIGQALVYACADEFDFVVYLFADTSADKRIRASLSQLPEAALVRSLWASHNIRFDVV